jgi:dihydrofolate reductase
MGNVYAEISVSLDGFVAGPNINPENPLGERGERLHDWVVGLESWRAGHGKSGGSSGRDNEVMQESVARGGAVIMGKNMFGPGEGAPKDDGSWQGWWGDDPPFHTPVYVLTHHPREPLAMEGGTTFHFVTEGIEAALEQAKAAAGDKDIHVAGGASAINQYLAAGLLDELYLHIVPLVLGGGARLLENVGDPKLEPVEVVASPTVTHVRYRVGG